MTHLQKIQLRQSETRGKINAALETPETDRSETWQSELASLTKRMEVLDIEYRAAIVSQTSDPEIEVPADDAEGRELRSLYENADLGNIFVAAFEKRSTSGAERELQSHFGLGSHEIPLDMLREPDGGIERRAAATITGDVGISQSPHIGYVYPKSVGAFLGVRQPTVPVGERSYPVLVTPATVHAPAKKAQAAETTGEFEVETLAPRRLQASFKYTREDAAAFGGMSDALRMNLNQALSDKLDKEAVVGAGGFLGTGGLTAPTAPNADVTFALFRDLVYGRIDGRYASVAGDVRLVVGAETYQKMASIYRGNNADDSALDSLMRVSGGVRVGGHVPDATTNNNDQELIAAIGSEMNAVSPVWQGVSLIIDEVTMAKEGEIIITAVQLFNFAILRDDGFARLAVQLGA